MILVKDDVDDWREVYTRQEIEELLAETCNLTQMRVASLERRLDALVREVASLTRVVRALSDQHP